MVFSLILDSHFQNPARLFDINGINAGGVDLNDHIIAVLEHRLWQFRQLITGGR